MLKLKCDWKFAVTLLRFVGRSDGNIFFVASIEIPQTPCCSVCYLDCMILVRFNNVKNKMYGFVCCRKNCEDLCVCFSHIKLFLLFQLFYCSDKKKLDGVGPVDNRPSTDQLHHFVQFFLNVKIYIYVFFLNKKIQKKIVFIC